MLIENLKSDPIVKKIICDECIENNIGVTISEKINKESDLLIIKVDDYYKEINEEKRPASPDCLILVKCKDSGLYSIYIIELKNIKDSGGFSVKNIREKFTTCINDFLSNVLRDHFYNDNIKFNIPKLYFISDPYNEKIKGSRHQKSKSTKMDSLLAMNTRPFKFDGKSFGIQHCYEDPMILPC